MFKNILFSSIIAMTFAGAAVADGHMATETSMAKGSEMDMLMGNFAPYAPFAISLFGILILNSSSDSTDGTDGTDGTGGTNGTSGS